MATILEAQNQMDQFFKEKLNKKGVIKEVTQTDSGWKGLFEALEKNELLKQMGHDVVDRTLYKIELDKYLNTTSYGVYNPKEEKEEKS